MLHRRRIYDGSRSLLHRARERQAFGATIAGGFGAAWLAFGMTEVGVPLKVGFALVLPVFVLIAFLGAAVRRRVPRVKKEESPEKQQMMRAFAAVNVVQWVAIFGVVNLLHNLHLDGWITGSIVLIVGAHFLPLARIFRASQHERTGWALMLLALASICGAGIDARCGGVRGSGADSLGERCGCTAVSVPDDGETSLRSSDQHVGNRLFLALRSG